jgi:hypothetical protein
MFHTKNTLKSNHNYTTTDKNKKFLGPASSHGGPPTIHTYIHIYRRDAIDGSSWVLLIQQETSKIYGMSKFSHHIQTKHKMEWKRHE